MLLPAPESRRVDLEEVGNLGVGEAARHQLRGLGDHHVFKPSRPAAAFTESPRSLRRWRDRLAGCPHVIRYLAGLSCDKRYGHMAKNAHALTVGSGRCTWVLVGKRRRLGRTGPTNISAPLDSSRREASQLPRPLPRRLGRVSAGPLCPASSPTHLQNGLHRYAVQGLRLRGGHHRLSQPRDSNSGPGLSPAGSRPKPPRVALSHRPVARGPQRGLI